MKTNKNTMITSPEKGWRKKAGREHQLIVFFLQDIDEEGTSLYSFSFSSSPSGPNSKAGGGGGVSENTAWQPSFFCAQNWSLSFIAMVSFPAIPILASVRGPTVNPICSFFQEFPHQSYTTASFSRSPSPHYIANTTPEQLFPALTGLKF